MSIKTKKKSVLPSQAELVQESKLYDTVLRIFRNTEIIRGGYYSWLLSPHGSPMQLDIYLPDLKLAFEYQGEQHYTLDPRVITKKDFDYLQVCDRHKASLCGEKSIMLIPVKYNQRISINLVLTLLQEAELLAPLRQMGHIADEIL